MKASTSDTNDAKECDAKECNAKEYSSLVGKLLFAATAARTDVSYAIGMLNWHLTAPTDDHMKFAKHLRNLKGTHYTGDGSLDIYIVIVTEGATRVTENQLQGTLSNTEECGSHGK